MSYMAKPYQHSWDINNVFFYNDREQEHIVENVKVNASIEREWELEWGNKYDPKIL